MTLMLVLLPTPDNQNDHNSWVRCVCFHANGLYVSSVSEDKSLRVWEVGGGVPCHLKPSMAPVLCPSLHLAVCLGRAFLDCEQSLCTEDP